MADATDKDLETILASADAAAKGWETNRKGTTENSQRYVRQDIAMTAMRRAYDLGLADGETLCRARDHS